MRSGRPLRLWVDGARVHLFNPWEGMSHTPGTGAGASHGNGAATAGATTAGNTVTTDPSAGQGTTGGPGSVRVD